MPAGQQPLGATEHPIGLARLDPRLVAAFELARERPPALRPRHHIAVVRQMTLAAASGPPLAAPEHLGLGRVQIKRHLLTQIATKPAIKLVAAPRRRPLDRTDM